MANITCLYSSNFTEYTDGEIELRFVAYVILTLSSTFANLLVVMTFIVEKSLRTTFNIFILHLAINDLLTSIFRMGSKAIILATVKGTHWPYGQAMCNFIGSIQYIMYISNIYIIMAIAICRYIAIALSKTHLITKEVVHIMMIITWLASLILSLLPIFGWNKYCYQPSVLNISIDMSLGADFSIFIMIATCFVPITVISICYGGIFINVKINSLRMRKVAPSEVNSTNTSIMHQITQREARATTSMFLIFVAYTICLAPMIIYTTVLGFISGMQLDRDILFLCAFMINFNSLCNPIIYAIRHKPFRKAYIRILLYCCPKYMQYKTLS